MYQSWEECRQRVHGHGGAQYAKFSTLEQAEAYLCSSSSKSQIVRAHEGALPDEDVGRGKKKRYLVEDTRSRCAGDELSHPVIIYTDGACHGNGRTNSRAGYGIYAPDHPSVTRYGPLAPHERHTNQRAELQAIKEAIRHGPPDQPLEIRTDSRYAMDCVTKWGDNWERQGWPADKKNADLVRDILESIRVRSQSVCIKHVPGHAGEPGNEMADQLANKGAGMASHPQA